MGFMCWNCRDLGNPAKLRELKQLLTANNPDLIFLRETKMSANDFRRVQNKCRMQNGLAVNSEGRSGGLALMWRDGMNVSIQNYSKHHIDSMVKLENNKNIRVTGFYGHANPNLRSNSWDILRRVGESVREEWIVGGDFNAILNDAEKEGGRRGVRAQMNEFKEGKKYGNLKRDMQKLEKHIDWIIDSVSRGESGRTLKETQRRLDFLYAREESYWAQRSRSNWLREGDRNTRYFYAKATGRLKNNVIEKLKNAEGQWVTNSKDINKVAKDYFVKLFRSNGQNANT
ncbi:hypothetical protein V6Z12_A11G273200 [Gossypium hirsutum]